jgi:transcriptional regulator with XRE-family HTH domain
VALSELNTIGARLKKVRGDRSMTQEDLAAAAGVSVDLIAKLEQGRRQTARITSLIKLADGLDIDLSELVGKRARLDADEDARVMAVRDAILDPALLPGIEGEDGDAPALTDVKGVVRGAWRDYWAGNLGRLTATLPGLIGEARMAAREHGPQAAAELGQAYELAACLCVHLGRDDLAVMAAERAIRAVEDGDDELWWAVMHGTYAWCTLHQGRTDVAERHAIRIAERIEPNIARAPLAHLTVWGSLLMTALACAAAGDRPDEARHYIGLARSGAGRFDAGDRHDYMVNFGLSQVNMQATHAYAVLRKPDVALKAAQGVDPDDLFSISWGRHLIDVAQAHVDARHLKTAETTLLQAEALSAEWFRHQGPARSLVGELVEETTRLSPTLRRLARSVDVER